MKKIDLHIHTVPTVSDSVFVFSIDVFRRYVIEAGIDIVAVTNHNVFDSSQFRQIEQELPIQVLPGIEIDVGPGHLLLIADGSDMADFDSKCIQVSSRNRLATDSITTSDLVSIFGDLSDYLLIPHHDKSPAIKGQDFVDLSPYFGAGEVDRCQEVH